MNEGIVFQVETSRILKILASEIYDSPLALLRENVQNAYDAIRMRFAEANALSSGLVEISIDRGKLAISDNGIGMSEGVLRNNFWKAGSSGKNSEEARRAGVVGTFGIGAMANFGVCKRLVVETRAVGSQEMLRSWAERDSLRIGEECIAFERVAADRDVGTTVTADLDSEFVLTAPQAIQYLLPYVSLLDIDLRVNGTKISGEKWETRLPLRGRSFSRLGTSVIEDNLFSAAFEVGVESNGQVLVSVTNIAMAGQEIPGELRLLQSAGQLMGFRSAFGLAPIPIASPYQFGGVANLPFLKPTAGREALSRESIDQVTRLVNMAEQAASEHIALSDAVDTNNAFLQWLILHNRYDLASRISVRMLPRDVALPLGEVKNLATNANLHYYDGNDHSIISTFANEDAPLLHVVQANPRRAVQLRVIQDAGVSSVPRTAQVLRAYQPSDLTLAEASLLVRITNILRDDYLVPEVRVELADISHGVTLNADSTDGLLRIWLARSSASLAPLLEVYERAYELFSQFIKDFVRVNVYPKIVQFVPTSTRGGVEALKNILERNRELYRYEEAERGELETILGEYLSGSVTFAQVLTTSRAAVQSHAQTLSREQVGSIESVVPDVVDSPVRPAESPGELLFVACPPIVRDSINTDKKLLTTNSKYPQLNNFRMFLGLSDRLVRSEGDFFHAPHTSRVLWAGHRVIFIFTDATNRLSLYYDIQLREPIEALKPGGEMFPTTTVLTKDRIFIPVPEQLMNEFETDGGPKEFVVRFDLLSNDIQ